MNRRKRKKYLKKHKELLNNIVTILDEVDPMGLISMARYAGFDLEEEYEPEAKAIVMRLEHWHSVRRLEIELKHVFDDFFRYPDIAPEYYRLAARRIWNAWLLSLGKPPLDFPDDIRLPKRRPHVVVEVD